MGKKSSSCLLLCHLAIIALFAGSNSFVQADERDDEIAKLKARLDALEQKAAPDAEVPIRPVDLLTQPALPAVPANSTDCKPLPKPDTKIKMEGTWKNALWFESRMKLAMMLVATVLGCVESHGAMPSAGSRNIPSCSGSKAPSARPIHSSPSK